MANLRFLRLLFSALPIVAVGAGLAADDALDACFRELPIGWNVTRTLTVPPDRLGEIEANLGAKIVRITNTWLSVHGQSIQVNIVQAASEADAVTLHAAITRLKGDPAYCVLQGARVIEYTGRGISVPLANTVSFELGFSPKPTKVRYRVVAELATVSKADYMSCNPLFNLFLRDRASSTDSDLDRQISAMAAKFKFGNQLCLRACASNADRPKFSFDPAPASWDYSQRLQRITYSFEQPRRASGVPFVIATLEVTADASAISPTTRQADGSLLAATPFWPVDDPEVVELAGAITSDCDSQAEKVDAVLKWVGPSGNIPSGGVKGSRWGVKRVLEQRFGRCWDRADCFVTLCRAAGVPCRQVAGWVYGLAGHVWAEVLIEGAGWQQVDPSGGGVVNCGIYHIPYFATEDGEMPILYVDMPQFEIVASE